MEDNKNINEEVSSEQTENKNVSITLTDRLINLSFSLAAIVLYALTSVIMSFVLSYTFVGIMKIFIYALAITGLIWNLVRSKKPTFDFYFSAGALAVIFMANIL